MASLKLTRENILSGVLHDSARALLGAGTRFMTAEERHRQIHEVIARAPQPERIWVFGYGSLIWNPAFHFAERRTARVHGYHRQFCLWARAGRGSPEKPGLMLSLEHGGSCHGVAYRIAPKHAAAELDIVLAREMVAEGYTPVWVRARIGRKTIRAVAFAIDRDAPTYAGRLSLEQTARSVARASGALGACADYLEDAVAHLEARGIHDRRLAALRRRVRVLRKPRG